MQAWRRQPRTWRAAAGVALAVVAALALRAWRLRQGLPDFLDEAIPLKQALEMWGWETGRTDLNPHFFHYPTLSIYLHFLLQKLAYAAGLLRGRFACPADYRLLYEIDPSGVVIAARWLEFAADALTVAAVWRLAERLRRGSGLPAALLAAFSPTLIGTARAIHADTFMAALLAWAVERLLAWREDGRRDQLGAAVVLIGLAAGAKYTAGLLVLPLAWALAQRGGRAGLARWPLAAAGALAVFLLSSPYVALDVRSFWHDFAYEGGHMAEGHLGTLGRTGALYYLRGLLADLGPAGLLLALGSLWWLRRPGAARSAPACVWAALAPQLAALAAFRMEAARYLLPVLPLAAALAAAAARAVVEAVARPAGAAGAQPRRGRLWPALLWAALLLPPLAAGGRAALAGRDATQQQARRWIEANLAPEREVILLENYGPVLRSVFQQEAVRGGNSYRAASAAVRARFDALPTWRAVTLPMAVSGRLGVVLERPGAAPLTATVFAHASEFNQVFYEPALLDGVDYFVTSGAVRRRYEEDPARYPAQIRFYGALARQATPVAAFGPGGAAAGPEITIWRLDPARPDTARLDPFWWAAPVPAEFRDTADRFLAPPSRRSGGAVRLPDGSLAPWLASLREPFTQMVLPFAVPLARHLAEAGRFAASRRLTTAVLAFSPGEIPAVLLHSLDSSRLGFWAAAHAAVERGLADQARRGLDSPDLRLERARLLAVTGDAAGAREELRRVHAIAAPGSEPARAARDMLEDLEAGRIPILGPAAAADIPAGP